MESKNATTVLLGRMGTERFIGCVQAVILFLS